MINTYLGCLKKCKVLAGLLACTVTKREVIPFCVPWHSICPVTHFPVFNNFVRDRH